jgi:uncharacterized membrane protein YesL
MGEKKEWRYKALAHFGDPIAYLVMAIVCTIVGLLSPGIPGVIWCLASMLLVWLSKLALMRLEEKEEE